MNTSLLRTICPVRPLPLTSTFLFALLVSMASPGSAATIVNNDFNDGTTQGWNASSISNEANQIRFGNFIGSGVAALQLDVFYPVSQNWAGAKTISFEMEFTTIDGLSAPSELIDHRFSLGNDFSNLSWNLDLTGWNFGEQRSFTLDLADAGFFSFDAAYSTPEHVLAEVNLAGFLFTTGQFGESTVASALMDNFLVTSPPVPEPSTSAAVLFGLLGLTFCGRRRKKL